MLFSARDIDILKLLRWCKLIRCHDLIHGFSETELSNLACLSLIKVHQKSGSFVLTTKGNQLLDAAIPDLPPPTPPAYRPSDTTRRLHLSEIMLTAYSAGLDVFAPNTSDLIRDQTLFLPSIARGRGSNPWGSTRVAALSHLGDLLCSVHYVCPEIGRLALNDELAALHNNTAMLSDQKRAFLFFGPNYDAILSELETEDTEPDAKLSSYREAYELLSLPVFLVPHGVTGAIQLRILSVPDYRRKLTQAALKSQYVPPPETFPHCDAIFQGSFVKRAFRAQQRRRRLAVEHDVCAAQSLAHKLLIAIGRYAYLAQVGYVA